MATTLELPLSMTEQELVEVKQDLAVVLYQRRVVSLAKGAEIAGLTRLDFQRLLAKRRVPLHIMVTDVEADLDTLRKLHKHTPIE
ncbi:MAG: UPF0175 family protein [Herpetosiphonaceae bacterium]|nr:UPF0175 family protein [Herpetosiphonaceae bacterium]